MHGKPNFEMWIGIVCGLFALLMMGVALQAAAEGVDAFRYWFAAIAILMVGVLYWWCGCALRAGAAEADKRNADRQDVDSPTVVRDPDATLH